MIGDGVSRLLRWIVHRAGERNLLLVGLLLLALSSVALGTADRVRGLDRGLALTMVAIGALAGWIVRGVVRQSWVGIPAMAMVGLGTVFLRVGRLGGELVALCWEIFALFRSIRRWSTSGVAPAWEPLRQALGVLWRGGATLVTRVTVWATALVTGEPLFDPVAVALVWGLGLWVVSAWAGWLICRRERPLWALTPAGVLLMVGFSYVWGSHTFLLGLLLAAFLLLATISYDRSVQRWAARNADYPELRAKTAVTAVFLSLALVATAQIVPSLSVRRIVQLVQDVGGNRAERDGHVAEWFGLERRDRTVFEGLQRGGLPRRHLVGSGPELSEKVVMIIGTGEAPPSPAEFAEAEPPRYYWRSHTYDIYTGSGWRTGETTVIEYEAGTPVSTWTPGAIPIQRIVRQAVDVVGDAGNLLHVSGTLLVADRDYRVAWRSDKDPFGATIKARAYRADAAITLIDEKGLRDVGTDYPAWVRDRYLALPDTIPSRVHVLARDLTAIAPTPYDRALAIEAYLREFPYTLDVPSPLRDRDVVDTFLFDLQRGYCDYYASAMVVLARAAGLPARLAVGYAAGTYDWTEARYVVTEADAHAWAEVYFGEYGWVKFEPTAGRPLIERPAEVVRSDWSPPEEPLGPAGYVWPSPAWWQGLIGGLALFGLAGVIWLAFEGRRLSRRQPLEALASIYIRLRRHGQRLAVPMRAGDTPSEFEASFAGRLEGFAGAGRVYEIVAPGVREMHTLTEIYVRATYSPRSADVKDQARAIQLWQRLRWRLHLAQLWRKVWGDE